MTPIISRTTRNRFVHLILAVLSLILMTSPASAGFAVCNKTPATLVLAFGRFDGKDWVSEGWWHIAKQNCAELIPGALKGRFYYLYATDGTFNSWEGDKQFCISVMAKFSINGRSACTARGFETKGFMQIDTGEALNWTQSISH